MDFAYDDRTQDLRERVLAFMEERVYPAARGNACPSPRSSRPRPAAAGCGTCS